MVEHERIVARRNELGISQAELARRVGVSQPAIVDIEKGRVQSTRYVIELARALDLQPSEVDPRFSNGAGAQLTNAEPLSELPVYKLDAGEELPQITALPINLIPRPAALHHIRGAYAVMLTEEDMAPEFEPGDVLLVNPHLPTLAGYSYVFRSSITSAAIVRRLIATDPINWTVKAWRLSQGDVLTSEIAKSFWPGCHRIIGKFSRG